MIKIEHSKVMNLEGAMRGARNPLNSWNRSDSTYAFDGSYVLGDNDLDLAKRLCRAGSDHRKFIRQILVSVDITAPMYWWKEFDTYKVGTVANSTSTMHKIHSKPFELDDFSHDHMSKSAVEALVAYIQFMEVKRQHFVETKDKADWYDIIQLLPSSYNQKRTVTMNYENLLNMCSKGQRRFHKLNEWSGVDNPDVPNFISWARTLPYAQELIFLDEIYKEEALD